MKFRRRKRSTTFKTHFMSALCRSLFTNASLIFVNSIFIKSVGSKSYSQLFFFASVASLAYYIYFAVRGDKEAYSVYKAVIGLALIASLLCFFESHWIVLEPYNKPLLYFFAVSVMVVDLIGTTLGPAILQLSVNPVIFREVYQKIVTAELVARVSAAGVVWFLSLNHWLEACFPIGWLTLAIHFVLFNVTLFRLGRVERKAKTARKKHKEHFRQAIVTSVKFMFSNSLVRAAMRIMIWSHVTKFLVEYLFYQTADANYSSPRQVASFVSITTMTMIFLSLFAQHYFGRKLTERLQLSTLFSIQPINVLILGSLALVVPPFWPLVLLMVTYNMINRSVQLPVSRQCLIPVPRSQRSTIISLICIMMSSSTMVVGGVMAVLKNAMHLQDFLIVLLVLSAIILFLIAGLDSFYIRNLWSFYREARSGNWQDAGEPEGLVSEELAPAQLIDHPDTFKATSDLTSHVVLEAYATSCDRDQLACASRDHRELLQSGDESLTLLGLKICFISGFPWFEPVLRRFSSHKSAAVREFAALAIKVDAEFRELSSYSCLFRRRIKAIVLELLQSSRLSEAEKVRSLLNASDRSAAESLVEALSDERFRALRKTLLNCIEQDGRSLTLQPVVAQMYDHDYAESEPFRHALQVLSFGRGEPEMLATIEKNLNQLESDKLALAAQSADKAADRRQLQLFMHTLFAEEFRLCPRELDLSLTNTIGEFQSLDDEDRGMLVDMHLEFLKRSELFKKWQLLLT